MRALCVALAASLLVSGCGLASRQRFAYSDLQGASGPQDLERVSGQEPTLAVTWLASAQAAPDADQALGTLERGLRFVPSDANLELARLSLLGQLGRTEAQVATARRALGHGQPDDVRAELRWQLVDALLARGETMEAEAEARRLGEEGADPLIVGSAWARVAAAHESADRHERADAAIEASLAMGGAGLAAVLRDTATDARRRQAARALFDRARERHPDQPDLALSHVVDLMIAGEPDQAEAALAVLPEPFPERLEADREAVTARLRLQQGDVEGALARARERLDEVPADLAMLAVMFEAHALTGKPDTAELVSRLTYAQRRSQDPAASRTIAAMLNQLQAVDAHSGR